MKKFRVSRFNYDRLSTQALYPLLLTSRGYSRSLITIFCWSVAIWSLGAGKLQAAGENSIVRTTLENWNSPSDLTEPTEYEQLLEDGQHRGNSAAISTSSHPTVPPSIPLPQAPNAPQLTSHSPHLPNSPFLIAAPENFNPGLRLPPPPPQPPIEPIPSSTSTEADTRAVVLESLTTDFRNDQDNFDQRNQFIEPTAQFRLRNGNRLRVRTGLNSFEQPDIESITNIPLQVGWEGKIDRVTVSVAGGVDLFNRLPTALNLNARVEAPMALNISPTGQVESQVVVSGVVEQGPYKFNAETLDNQITAWRFGPNVYWQIDRNTSLYSSFRWGEYNDGNEEQQSFSRLERKLGQFSVAANLFTWSYDQDLDTESGYFSPPDFLVYNGEVAWQGDVFDFLRCRLAATLGQQRLRGEIDDANSYQARCTVQFSPNVEADLGYGFSNVRNQDTGGSTYNNQSVTGQLRVRF